MTRLHHVKKARKPIKGTDIRRGDEYFWWKFPRVPRCVSKVRPPRSALTRSEFRKELWDLEDGISGMDHDDPVAIADRCEEARGRLDELAEELREKKENMPEHLQDGPTGELLDERADGCEEIAEELQEAADLLRALAEGEDDGELEEGDDEAAERDGEDGRVSDLLSTVDWSRV